MWSKGAKGKRAAAAREAALEESYQMRRRRPPRRGGKAGCGVPHEPKDPAPTLTAEADPPEER